MIKNLTSLSKKPNNSLKKYIIKSNLKLGSETITTINLDSMFTQNKDNKTYKSKSLIPTIITTLSSSLQGLLIKLETGIFPN